MKPTNPIAAALLLAFSTSSGVQAEETSPEIAGLKKAASDFVTAFNKKDAAALAKLFAENGEVTDLNANYVVTGRADIQARYEAIFAAPAAPQIAIEVDSVRLVGKNLAIEDGTVHSTAPGEGVPPQSFTYTAVFQKGDDGGWLIASSRDLEEVTGAAGQLAGLAEQMKGDWTCMRDGLRLDLAFGWDDSGNFVSGEMLATAADAEPLSTNIRIGWDAAKKSVTWWSFDDGGGFSKGDWTPTEDGWLIRTEGTTADGEVTSANQTLVFEGKDTFLWTATARLVDGEKQPDIEMRVVRQTPEPSAE